MKKEMHEKWRKKCMKNIILNFFRGIHMNIWVLFQFTTAKSMLGLWKKGYKINYKNITNNLRQCFLKYLENKCINAYINENIF